MAKESREFIMRGDVLDPAADVVTGSALTSIVNQVMQGLTTPLIGWIVAMVAGTSDLEGVLSILDWSLTKGVVFTFGNAISAIVTFLIIGSVLLLVVKAANRVRNLRVREVEEEAEETPTVEDYLSDIRDLLAKQVVKNNTHPAEQANLPDISK